MQKKTKKISCYYNHDEDCLKIEKIVNKYHPNYFICLNCKKAGKPNPDKRYSNEANQKRKQTLLDKYGVTNCRNIDGVNTKILETSEQRYGGIGYASKELLEKAKSTMKEKYNVENCMYIPEVKDLMSELQKKNSDIRYKKMIKTLNTKYGTSGIRSCLQVDSVREKGKNKYFERTGYTHPLKNPEVINKIKESNRKKFFDTLFNSNRLKELCKPDFTFEDYTGVKLSEYKWICKKCNNKFVDNIDNGSLPRCTYCYPRTTKYQTSEYENQIYDFLQLLDDSLTIIRNDRTNLPNNKEIDLYIPDYNIGIEFNGLYWHSEANGKDSSYHIRKTKEAEENDIQLIHIFEDEWIEKQSIVKSMIKNRLNKIENRIYARNCNVKEIDNIDANIFYFDNHLQGPINSVVHIGLLYSGRLVSMISMGKPRYNKQYEYEILRYCTKVDMIVVGGLSKLFKYFVSEYNPTSIITYSDARLSNGHGYLNLGFNFLKLSDPNYYYVKNAKRFSRIKFQKHKLEKQLDVYFSELTEYQNMQLNGYNKIWDCGNYVYTWKK